ncbi:MAG: DUF1990 domain-containing protein [Planctomycetota bacterium]|nr:DUF1990 domain-containing protein [Planctomycetota bacterium]
MLSIRKPTESQIQQQLALQGRLPFNYQPVGATKLPETPPGYHSASCRVLLGHGESTYLAARQALAEWRHYPTSMLELHCRNSRIEEGNVVGILVREFGVWSLNTCRIVYTVDQQNADRHAFGFAYGTLPAHLESGEERFLIEWNRQDDSVWYKLDMFCRPAGLLGRLADFRVKKLQRRFQNETLRAMQSATDAILQAENACRLKISAAK